jgi:hypothetical protein
VQTATLIGGHTFAAYHVGIPIEARLTFAACTSRRLKSYCILTRCAILKAFMQLFTVLHSTCAWTSRMTLAELLVLAARAFWTFMITGRQLGPTHHTCQSHVANLPVVFPRALTQAHMRLGSGTRYDPRLRSCHSSMSTDRADMHACTSWNRSGNGDSLMSTCTGPPQ